MKWKEFNQKQREVISEKLFDLGNIAVGSLVFGVIIKAELFSRTTLTLGLIISLAAYWLAVRALR